MSDLQGFWSYVHEDDETDRGRITQLARDVGRQFDMLTGDRISMFLDRDSIQWGEEWRDRIDSSLVSVAFFIPFLTPRYFLSPECRRELQFFARKATQLGIRELVLPVLYVDFPSLHDSDTKDELVRLARSFQWEDWTDLRFADVNSENYRRGVHRLASRLVAANHHAEQANISTKMLHTQSDDQEGADDTPGLLDRIAKAEETLPRWNTTLAEITHEINLFGEIMIQGTAEIGRANKQGRATMEYRLRLARKIATQLEGPAERVWTSSNLFVSQLHDIDDGVIAIIEQARVVVDTDPTSKADICAFFNVIRRLYASADQGLSSAQQLIDTLAPIEHLSRDLRPPIRRLKQGLVTIVEARKILHHWAQLTDASGIECPEDLVPPSQS